MPLRDFVCDSCQKAQERFYQQTNAHVSITARGGLVTSVTSEQTDPVYPPCDSCGGSLTVQPLAQDPRRFVGSVFPFTTTHVDNAGRPMVIENMGHLRAVEKKYGVVLSAFSNRSTGDLTPIKDLPRYRGQDPDFHKSGY
jgi:hypothetical protein